MTGTISPWLPEQSRLRLALLGKLAEECAELGARASRCIIHGLDERDPDTGRLNSDELRRELSDVHACMQMIESRLGIRPDVGRALEKYEGFYRWHRLIEAAKSPTADAIREALEPDNRG